MKSAISYRLSAISQAARNLSCCLLFSVLWLSACSQADPEAAARSALTSLRQKMTACLREPAAEGNIRLAVVSLARTREETVVRLAAYNYADPSAKETPADTRSVDFDVPNYLMSRGRWLLNESGRVYLMDERCRQYKLVNRKLTMRQTEAVNGRIEIKPGEVCEVLLSFTRLPEDVQTAVLVYGSQVLPLPFSLNP